MIALPHDPCRICGLPTIDCDETEQPICVGCWQRRNHVRAWLAFGQAWEGWLSLRQQFGPSLSFAGAPLAETLRIEGVMA